MEEDIINFTATILIIGFVFYGGSFYYKRHLAIEAQSHVVLARIEKKRQAAETDLQNIRLHNIALEQERVHQEYLQKQAELQNALREQQNISQQQAHAQQQATALYQQQLVQQQQQATALYQQQLMQEQQQAALQQQQATAAARQRTVRNSRAS